MSCIILIWEASRLLTPRTLHVPLRQSRSVHVACSAVAKPENGFSAVLCLAWALTKDAILSSSSSTGGSAVGGQQQMPLSSPGFDGTTPGPTATALLEVAGKARALGTLSALLSSVSFQLETEGEHR